MKKRTLIMVISLVFMMTVGVFAQGHRYNKRGAGPGFQELNLTDAQQESLSKIRYNTKKQMIAIKFKVSLAKLEMSEIIKDRNFSKSKAKSQLKKIIEYKSEMAMVKFDSMDQKRKIFTDDQWKIVSKRFKHKGFGKGKSRGKRKGRHHERMYE